MVIRLVTNGRQSKAKKNIEQDTLRRKKEEIMKEKLVWRNKEKK